MILYTYLKYTTYGLSRFLLHCGLSATHLTCLRGIFMFIALPCVWRWGTPSQLLTVYLLQGYCDLVDGTMASLDTRGLYLHTLGAFMDPLIDKVTNTLMNGLLCMSYPSLGLLYVISMALDVFHGVRRTWMFFLRFLRGLLWTFAHPPLENIVKELRRSLIVSTSSHYGPIHHPSLPSSFIVSHLSCAVDK